MMIDVAIASAAAVLLIAVIAVIAIRRRRRRRGERGRKTLVIQAALPFVPMARPAMAALPPPPTRMPSHTPPPPAPTEPDVIVPPLPPTSMSMPVPLEDDGPTAVDPRYAGAMEIEGPTIRGPGVPPPRPTNARARDANVRAAIRANTIHASFTKSKR